MFLFCIITYPSLFARQFDQQRAAARGPTQEASAPQPAEDAASDKAPPRRSDVLAAHRRLAELGVGTVPAEDMRRNLDTLESMTNDQLTEARDEVRSALSSDSLKFLQVLELHASLSMC